MPESDRPEGGIGSDGARLERELAALESGLARLLEEHARMSDRARETEAAHDQLAEALRAAGPERMDSGQLEDRLRGLVRENRRLREIIEEGRERAERIRSRLIVIEDEL